MTSIEALTKLLFDNSLEHIPTIQEKAEMTAIIAKELKALEIIKEKRVNVRAFLKCCHIEDGLTIYNNQCDDKQEKESKELTKEEYDLLKEVLK